MNKSVAIKGVAAFLLIAVVLLGFKATDQQNQLLNYTNEKEELSQLLTGSDAALGYSCGVLTQQRAQELLEGSPDLRRSFGQGPTDIVQATKAPQERLLWSDSCRYVDISNSERYIEMYVATFQTDADARRAFPDFLQVVNDAVEIPSEKFGQQLFYDGGAYYLLKNNIVIQIAANNGVPQELEAFSRDVFEKMTLWL